jgi:hypothetical protein
MTLSDLLRPPRPLMTRKGSWVQVPHGPQVLSKLQHYPWSEVGLKKNPKVFSPSWNGIKNFGCARGHRCLPRNQARVGVGERTCRRSFWNSALALTGARSVGSALGVNRTDGRVERHYAWLLVGRPPTFVRVRSGRGGLTCEPGTKRSFWEPLIWRTQALISP